MTERVEGGKQNYGAIGIGADIWDVTIAYFNCSRSNKDSWFVSFSTPVPTKIAKSLTPLFRGGQRNNMGAIGIGASLQLCEFCWCF